MATTAEAVFRHMKHLFKGFPDNYLVFDIETTGGKVGEDLIGQLGYAKVRDGVQVETGGVFLDWTRHPGVDQDWLRGRLARTTTHVADRNVHYQVTYERLQAGMEPNEALRRYLTLFLENREAGFFLVAHNGYRFDVRFIEEHFSTFLDVEFKFGDNELFDTGMLEKSSQARLVPTPGESMRDFFTRAGKGSSKGVQWSLSDFCVPKYRLDAKTGISVVDAHDAVVDCVFTRALFEEHRKQAGDVSWQPTTSGGSPSASIPVSPEA